MAPIARLWPIAKAFLSKTVTRLCLDHLKSARVKRETYIGPWVPEPMIEPDRDR